MKHGLEKEAALILEEERRLQLLQMEDEEINRFMEGLDLNRGAKSNSLVGVRNASGKRLAKCGLCQSLPPCTHTVEAQLKEQIEAQMRQAAQAPKSDRKAQSRPMPSQETLKT